MAATYDFDTIVIGAGVIGSSSAYQLTRLTNRRILLIEQYPLRHDKGSSHGASRIVRYVQDYGAATHDYMPLIMDAYKEWAALEQLCERKLLLRNGLLWLGDKAQTLARATVIEQFGCEHDVLSGDDVQKRFPHLRYGANGGNGREWWAVWDPNGGTLLADKAIDAMLEQFSANGGVVRDCEQVLAVEQVGSKGAGVLVSTNKALYKARNVIIACGAWANKLLPDYPVPYSPLLVGSYFWQVKAGSEKDYTPSEKPHSQHSPCTMMEYGKSANCYYMIPCVDYPDRVKVSIHRGVPIADIGQREQLTTPPSWLATSTAEHIRRHLPGLDATNGPAIAVTCLYAMTDDEELVFGRHPQWGNVFLAGPMAGTGFKFGPAVGRIMALLAEKGHFPDYDITAFGVKSKRGENQESKL